MARYYGTTVTPGARANRSRPRLPDAWREAALPEDDVADEALLRGLRYGDLDLTGRRARLLDVETCAFERTRLSEGRLAKVSVVDSVFSGCDLANLVLEATSFTRTELTDCRTTGLAAPKALLRHVLFRDCVGDFSAFRFATLTKVEFDGCRLHRADFTSADLTSATFRRCDLQEADFSQARAKGAVFVDCGWAGVRGVASLAGARVAHASPVDAEAFTLAMASTLGIVVVPREEMPDT